MSPAVLHWRHASRALSRTILGKLLRLPLHAIPRDAVLRILSGPNRGLRWVVGAGVHRCWIGTYETLEISRFLRHVTPQSVVWDVGAHAGYFSLACRNAGTVVACEPSPGNLASLRRHVALNDLGNFIVVPAAICERHRGSTRFGSHDSSYEGRIGGQGTEVPTATIDGLVDDGLPPPTIIKMDIEGAELDALPGARRTLERHRPLIMVATHSDAAMAFTPPFLQGLGYRTEVLRDCVWGFPSEMSQPPDRSR